MQERGLRRARTVGAPTLVPVSLTGLRGVSDEVAADAPTVIALQAQALAGLPDTQRKDAVAFVTERRDRLRATCAAEFDCEVQRNDAHPGPRRSVSPRPSRGLAPRPHGEQSVS